MPKDFYYFPYPMTIAGQDYVREKHYDKPGHYVNHLIEYPNDIK